MANGDNLLTSLGVTSRPNIVPQNASQGGGLPQNNSINQNSLANVNLQQSPQRSVEQSDTRLMSTMNQSIEAASRQVTSAIQEQTQVMSQGLGAVAQSISQGFQNMGQLLQQLFKDRAMLVAESENLNSAMAEYSKYTTNFFSTLFEKKYASLLSAVKEPLKGWEDVQEKLVNFMGSSESIAKILELTPLSKVKNPTELAPFTKDIADAIKISGESLKIMKIYQENVSNKLDLWTDNLMKPSYTLQTSVSQYSAQSVQYLGNIYKILYNIYDIGYSKKVRDEIKSKKQEIKTTDQTIKDLESRKRNASLTPSDEKRLNTLKRERSKLKESLSSYQGISPASKVESNKISSSKEILNKDVVKEISTLDNSIQMLTNQTRLNLEALKENTTEIKNQTPFSDVLSTFGMTLLNPGTWWKLITGPLGKLGMYYGAYKLIDAGVQWAKPKISNIGNTFIPGTNNKTIGSVFTSGKNMLSQYVVDPMLTGLKKVFKWILGDEWFNRIGGYLSTIKTYTVDVAHALFGDSVQKEAARSKLGKIIHDKVYDAISAAVPIILKAIMVYRGTKALLNPRSLVNAFREIGFGKVAGIFNRSEDKSLLNSMAKSKFDNEMVNRYGKIRSQNIVQKGNKAYLVEPRRGFLGALGLKSKKLIESNISKNYAPSEEQWLLQNGYTIRDGEVFKDGKPLNWENGGEIADFEATRGRFQNATRTWKQTKIGKGVINKFNVVKNSMSQTKSGSWILNSLGTVKSGFSFVFKKLGSGLGILFKPLGFILKGVGIAFKGLLGPLGLVISAFSALSFFSGIIAKFAKRKGDGSVAGGLANMVGGFLSNVVSNLTDTIKTGITFLPDIIGGAFKGIWRFIKREGPALLKVGFIDVPKAIISGFWEATKWLGGWLWKGLQWLGHYVSFTAYTPDWMETGAYRVEDKFKTGKESQYGEEKDAMAYLLHSNKIHTALSNTFSDIQFENGKIKGDISQSKAALLLQTIKDNAGDDDTAYLGSKLLLKKLKNVETKQEWEDFLKEISERRSQEDYSVARSALEANEKLIGDNNFLAKKIADKTIMDKASGLKIANDLLENVADKFMKPYTDQIAKEAEQRRKDEEDAKNKELDELRNKQAQEISSAGSQASIGSLAQWFQSGAAQKFIKDSINSLGEKIKAGWEFLKNQDYKKMFGDAMEVFGGVTGNIMGTIFGEDKANAWLDNALKYAESNQLNFAKKFLSGAKNSLKDNVAKTAVNTERTAVAVEKLANGQMSPNNGSLGAGSLGSMLNINAGQMNTNLQDYTQKSISYLNNGSIRSKQLLLPKEYNLDSNSRTSDSDLEKWMGSQLLEGSSSVTSRFGQRNISSGNNFHSGIDFAAAEGTPIKSFVSGKVIISKEQVGSDGKLTGYGQYVSILGNDGLTYTYGHMSKRLVNVGDVVNSGQVIGNVGNTGTSIGKNGGYHLHFDVKKGRNLYIPPELVGSMLRSSSYNLTANDSPNNTGLSGAQNSNVQTNQVNSSGVTPPNGTGNVNNNVNSKGFDFGRHLLNAEGSRLGDNGTSRFGMWYWNLKSYAKDSSIDMSDSFRKKLLSSNMDELKSIMQDDKNLSELARIGKSVLYRRYSSNNTIGSYTQFPHPVDYLIMDHAYNAGPGGANRVIKIAAEMYGYKPTGTKDAFNFLKTKMGDPITLGAMVASARLEHYKRIVANNPSKGKYLKGWYNRVTNLAKQFGYTRNGDVFTHNGQAITQKNTTEAKVSASIPPSTPKVKAQTPKIDSKQTKSKVDTKPQTPKVDVKIKEDKTNNQTATVKDPETLKKLQDSRNSFRKKLLADRKNKTVKYQNPGTTVKSSDVNPDQPVKTNVDKGNKVQIPKFEDSSKGKFEFTKWMLEHNVSETKVDTSKMFKKYYSNLYGKGNRIASFLRSKNVDKNISSAWGRFLRDTGAEAANINKENFWIKKFKNEAKLSDFDIVDVFKFLNKIQGFDLYDINKVNSILGIKEFKFDTEQFKTGMSSISQALKKGLNKHKEKVKSSAIDDVSNIFNSDKFMTNFMFDGKFNPEGEYSSNFMAYNDIFNKLNSKKLTAETAKNLLTSKELDNSQKSDLKEYISILNELLATFVKTYGKNDDRTIQLTNVINQLQNRQNSTNISQQGNPAINAAKNIGRKAKEKLMSFRAS